MLIFLFFFLVDLRFLPDVTVHKSVLSDLSYALSNLWMSNDFYLMSFNDNMIDGALINGW